MKVGWADCKANTQQRRLHLVPLFGGKNRGMLLSLTYFAYRLLPLDKRPTVPAVKYWNSNYLGHLGNKKAYVRLFSTVIKRKNSVILSRVIFQSRAILECDRLQLYHRYQFQCLCLYFPLVNNYRIQRLGRTFGHPLMQPPLLSGASQSSLSCSLWL